MKSAIIAALLVATALVLGGCSALRLGYSNGPQLVWWWLDGYVDFSREQAPAARQAVDRWFAWHRGTQLSDYADALAALREAAAQPATPAQLCAWNARARELVAPALDRALQEAADLLPGLGEAQWRAIDKRFAKSLDELRSEHLQPDAAERRREATRRAVAQFERLYGTLDEAQQRRVADAVAASPFEPERWAVERQRRQRDTLATLRRLSAEKADRDGWLRALRDLVERSERSPDPDYRAYQRRLTDYNCGFASQMHNAATPAQRRHAQELFKGWEDDLRALAAEP